MCNFWYLMKYHLIEFFHFPAVEDDTIGDDDRNKFFI